MYRTLPIPKLPKLVGESSKENDEFIATYEKMFFEHLAKVTTLNTCRTEKYIASLNNSQTPPSPRPELANKKKKNFPEKNLPENANHGKSVFFSLRPPNQHSNLSSINLTTTSLY